MKVGLALPHYDFSFPDGQLASVERVVAYARYVEQAGFDSVWVSDHLFLDLEKYGGPAERFATPEALATLSAIAAATERVRLGSLVLCAPFRNPAVTAAASATLGEASGGRFELGLGAGWYEAEFAAAGIAFGTVGARMDALAASARAVRVLPGARPRVWIGGKGGPRLMRVIAASADGWNVSWRITPDELRARQDVLAAACARVRRDPASVAVSVGLTCLVGTDERDLARRYESLRAWAPGGALADVSLEQYARAGLVGTIDECAARVKEFAAAGVEEIILSLASLPFSVYDDEQIDLVTRELLPRVR